MTAEYGHKRRRGRALLVVAGMVLALTAALPAAWAATAPGLERFYGQQLTWGECERPVDGVRCSRVTVPVDWAEPRGATIELAVARRKGHGRGTLILHPGGPGVSGVGFVSRDGQMLTEYGLAGYDLIGWDTRGTGRSAPLVCPPEATAAIEAVDSSPDTVAEATTFEAAAGRWAGACRAASGPVFDHMDTGSTARDLDVLRAVLGESKLNYLGISYGTITGGRYAELFPSRVGRMVLDSAGHPDHTYPSFMAGVAEAKERSLTGYLNGCAKRPECPFVSTPAAAAREWIQQLLRQVDSQPLHSGTTSVSQAQLAAVVQRDLGSPGDGWERLDAELAELRAGGATIVAQTAPATTLDIQNISTTCQDLPDHRTATRVLHDAARTSRLAPVLGWEVTAGSPCTRWPAPAPTPPHRLHAPGAPPVLVVGITHDTGGPYRWSRELAAQLGDARLLTLDGTGHGAYLLSRCVRDAANGFLADGGLPPPGTVCRD